MSWGRRLARLAGLFAVVIIVFIVAMTAVFALPRAPIRAHIAESISQLEAEGESYKPFFGLPSYRMDNYTDKLMLGIAAGKPGESPLRAGLVGWVAGSASAPAQASLQPTQTTLAQLQATVADDYSGAYPYTRYWHGYLVLLRPALVFFSYIAIRYLNMIVFAFATLGLLLLVNRRIGSSAAFALLVSLLAVSALTIPMTLEFSPVFLIAVFASIAVLLAGEKRWFARCDLEFFMVVGMLTSFSDFLTAPLVTIGLPLLMLLLLRESRDAAYSWKIGLLLSLRMGVAWAIGYVLCWVSKWLIGAALIGGAVLTDAASTVTFRIGGAVAASVDKGLGAIPANVAMLVPLFGLKSDMSGLQLDVVIAYSVLVFIALSGLVALALVYRKPWKLWSRQAPLLAVGALPYGWFLVVRNHSTQHFWFTYRIQVIAVFAAMCFVLGNTDHASLRARLGRVGWIRRVTEADPPSPEPSEESAG